MTRFLAFLAVALAFAPASAADIYGAARGSPAYVMPSAVATAPTWTGLYIGAAGGYGHTVLSDDDGRGGLDLSGLFGGVRAGGDIQRDAIVFGVWGEYNVSGQEFSFADTTLVEQTQDWSVNGRIGLAHANTLFYGFAGYGQVFFEASEAEADAPMWRAGAGIEHKFQGGLSLGIEYAHSWIDADELFGEGAEDLADVNEDRVTAVARWRFGDTGLGLLK